MLKYRKNVSGKIQIITGWPSSVTVNPSEYVKSEVVKSITDNSIFGPEEEMNGLSFPVEKRDIHGNVLHVMDSFEVGEVKSSMGDPSYSVIIPAYGRPDCLSQCLAGLSQTKPVNCEVIIVDDNPEVPVGAVPDWVRLIRNEKNLGFAASCNRGVRESKGQRIVLLNSDTVPKGDWLNRMSETMDRFAAGIVGAKLLYPQSEKTQHAGMVETGDGLYVHTNKGLPKDNPCVCVDKLLGAVSGACLMIERKAWERLHGLDEGFGKGYFEDVDLCLRWLSEGGRVAYCGTTEVLHFESASIGARSKEWVETLEKSAKIFREKWPQEKQEELKERNLNAGMKVDIIVSVHNSLSATMNCLESVKRNTPDWFGWRVWVADDCSDRFVSDTLQKFCQENSVRFIYSRNEINKGYLPTIDAITKTTNAPLICYLNSDTVVTRNWLTKMVMVYESDKNAKMVMPMTNQAAHLSVPMLAGSNYNDMNERFERASKRMRFDFATPVGFCLMVERKALEECGGWDVAYYGRGYGEETDLYMRMKGRGYQAAMADDCFVYHEGGGTFWQFGSKQKQEHDGYTRFMNRWKAKAEPLLSDYNRKKTHRYILPLIATDRPRRRQVVFVFVEVTMCGGVLSVVNICNRLIEMGWDASFACVRMGPGVTEKLGMRFAPYVFGSRPELIDSLRKQLKDADVVATIWNTAEDVAKICKDRPDLRSAYFIQDLEYMFRFPNGKAYSDEKEVIASYTMINRRVVNSDWVMKAVAEHIKQEGGHKIGIGVDPLMFYPRDRDSSRVSVMAHCRPSTARRGWDFLSKVMQKIKEKYVHKITTVIYDQMPENFHADVSLGSISPWNLAKHMGQAHIFLEGSRYQGWGMQGLEAMACGCALVCTRNRGIDNYGTDEHDCLLVDFGDVDGMVAVVSRLIEDKEMRESIGKNARETAKNFDWKYVAEEWDRYLRETR